MSRTHTGGHIVYKVVLTGGPCGGKTTGQNRLATFFENLGWKVYRVPETATTLIGGGVNFAELSPQDAGRFQEDLLLCMLRIEDAYFHLSDVARANVLIIHDRGSMDPSAYIDAESWQRILDRNELNKIDLRDNRYNQVVHMVTAADGATKYYTLSNNRARSESLEEAMHRDAATRRAWMGHPCYDLVDNSNTTSFNDKINKLIQVVCDRIPGGVEYGDRLAPNSFKRKWLVLEVSSDAPLGHDVEEFDVVHDYLLSPSKEEQLRIRKRGRDDYWSYTQTVRRRVNDNLVETKMALSKREYETLRKTADHRRASLYKRRCCFNHGSMYYQLDTYTAPLPPSCPQILSSTGDLMILETYTTKKEDINLPDFLRVHSEITGDSNYSMFKMSLKHLPENGADRCSVERFHGKVVMNGHAH